MTDRELLEAAAKAAGIEGEYRTENLCVGGDWMDVTAIFLADGMGWWNALEDDGDALRLAVALDIRMTPGAADSPYAVAEWWVRPSLTALDFERVLVEGDRDAALRRAVVLVAAAIGAAPVLGAA